MKNPVPFFILLLLIASCHKTQQQQHFTTVNMSDYPVNTGNTWTYQVWDSINNITDTAVFKITTKTVLNADTSIYNFQTTVNGVAVDSGTITQSLTAFTYLSLTSNTLFESLRLAFPINANSHWQGHIPGDTLNVISGSANFTVLGNTYSNVCSFHRSLIIPDYYVQATAYLAPGVGIVQETIDIEPWIRQYKTIRLISYYVH